LTTQAVRRLPLRNISVRPDSGKGNSPSKGAGKAILGVEEDRDLSDLVNEAIGDLLGKRE